MAQRKAWSPQEDNALKQIIEIKKIKKWASVSKIMEVQYDISGRSGKQCRERWHNQLKPDINNTQWSRQEELMMFQMHDEIGNSWAKMSKRLKGRTDNCIKNHFYSTLRKAVRRLNRYISQQKPKGMRTIKDAILAKIITVAQQKFQKKLTLPEKLIETSVKIKNELIQISVKLDDEGVDFNENKLRPAVQLISYFIDNYKIKRKPNPTFSIEQKSIPAKSIEKSTKNNEIEKVYEYEKPKSEKYEQIMKEQQKSQPVSPGILDKLVRLPSVDGHYQELPIEYRSSHRSSIENLISSSAGNSEVKKSGSSSGRSGSAAKISLSSSNPRIGLRISPIDESNELERS